MDYNNIYPDFAEFKKLYRRGFNLIPVWTEVIADFLTPVSCFYNVTLDSKNAALLESVEGSERWGRYSFIVVSPSEVVRTYSATSDNNILEYLREKYLKDARPVTGIKELPRFWGGAVGYISYDFVRRIENINCGNREKPEDLNLPESVFFIANTLIIFDHLFHTIKVVQVCDMRNPDGRKISDSQIKKIYEDAVFSIQSLVRKISRPTSLSADAYPLKSRLTSMAGVKFESNFTKKDFMSAVRCAKKYILEGDIIQVVLSQRFQMKSHCPRSKTLKPFDIYRALRMTNPSPYMYYFKFEDFDIAGSSPEILVRKEGNIAITKPIAGTRRRGANNSEDKILEEDLLSDPKERAEHVMLVDLGRNDLARVCVEGSVKVDEFMRVEKYSHVMHMVSTVSGKMKKGEDAFSLFRACFPAGTVTGAPKVRAMQIIENLEPVRRGIYAGAVGYFSYDGNMDTAITIRTVVFKDGVAYMQAGAGIVADSIPEKEYEETLNKARALMVSVRLSEKISRAAF